MRLKRIFERYAATNHLGFLKLMKPSVVQERLDEAVECDHENKWIVAVAFITLFPDVNLMQTMVVAIRERSLNCIGYLMQEFSNNKDLMSEGFLQAAYYNQYDLLPEFVKKGADVNYISEWYAFGSKRSSAWQIAIAADNVILARHLQCLSVSQELPLDPDGQTVDILAKGKAEKVYRFLNNSQKSVVVEDGLSVESDGGDAEYVYR